MVKILADSTCDLSEDLLKKYNVNILPLHVILGEEDYRDGVDITVDEIYEWADAHEATPKTSAVSPKEAMDAMAALLETDEDELICFSISESMSSTHSVMKMAAEALEVEDRVYCIDSQNLSTGIGLLILEAATMVQQGKYAREIAEYINVLREKVRSSFVVDTLTYLHRGGRCSSVAAMAGGMLKLHPRIAVENGRMEAGKKYRGKISKVLFDYVKEMEADLLQARTARVFITHSGCEQALLDDVHEYLENLGVFEEILITRAGSVISSHCGPGTLGVLFIAK